MPDIIDNANVTAERFNQQALGKQLQHPAKQQSRRHCLDCEEPIPEARRKAIPGCQRCIECQEIYEHWRAL